MDMLTKWLDRHPDIKFKFICVPNEQGKGDRNKKKKLSEATRERNLEKPDSSSAFVINHFTSLTVYHIVK